VSKFPDLTGDGQVTKADILRGRGVYKKGGTVRKKMPGKVEKVMKEFKAGKLHSGSKNGPVVKSRKQAVAIAFSEARMLKKRSK